MSKKWWWVGSAALVGGGIATALWCPAEPPEAPVAASKSSTVAAAEPPPMLDPTPPSDPEAHQAAGRAEPGAAPVGEGEPVLVGEAVVGRIWRAAEKAPLIVVASEPGVEAVATSELLHALRRTRDYHLLRLDLADGVEPGPGVDAAIAALGDAPLATVVIAAGAAAWPATRAFAGRGDWLALALVAPRALADTEPPGAEGLQGRQIHIVHAAGDSAGAATVAALKPAPLLQVRVVAGGRTGLGLLAEVPRARSDLLGWLFAVTPRP
ncbi:MAG: hypothetical protein H6747_13120 [Deltaproteobacteria bacterium]|nr:hypothetical protein [Deltaproteobacteria bacterium]